MGYSPWGHKQLYMTEQLTLLLHIKNIAVYTGKSQNMCDLLYYSYLELSLQFQSSKIEPLRSVCLYYVLQVI